MMSKIYQTIGSICLFSILAFSVLGCVTTDESSRDSNLYFIQAEQSPLTSDRASTGGVSLIDFDADGDADAIITNGYDVSSADPQPQANKFYQNRNGVFQSVEFEGLSELQGYGSGSSWADLDNDGDLDAVFANQRDQGNFFTKQHLSDDGSIAFSLMEGQTISGDKGWSYSVALADADNDGFVDVYISNGGLSHSGVNFLYQNEKGKSLQKVERIAPVTEDMASGGASWADYDNDGDQDLLVANRASTDPSIYKLSLYRNDGNMNFTRNDAALPEDTVLSMSAAWGDVDNDGDLDIYAGNLYGFANVLYENLGDGTFKIKDGGAATYDAGYTYATTFGDLDNDGDLDIVAANWGAASEIYLNDGKGVFASAGTAYKNPSVHFASSVAMADTDLDGDLDLLIGNWPNSPGIGKEENVLIQNSYAHGNWLRVTLEGTASNRSAIGARLELRYQQDGEEKLQIREVNAHSGWRSQSELTQHFGLGDVEEIDSLIVRWPSGNVQNLTVEQVNVAVTIVESE